MDQDPQQKHPLGSTYPATKLQRQLVAQQIPFEEDLPAIVEKIRKVNDEANNCVQYLRDFNYKITETISGLAKKQILVSGDTSIEPRVTEMYKSLTRQQLLVQQPETNQLSLIKMTQRVQKIEESDIVYTMKVRNEITRIKEMLDKILNKGKQT